MSDVPREFDRPVVGYRVFRVKVANDEIGEFVDLYGEHFQYPHAISKPLVSSFRVVRPDARESDPEIWRSAFKEAECVPGFRSGTSEPIRVAPHGSSPHPKCDCGVYAFHHIGYAVGLADRGSVQDIGPRSYALVVGAVLGRGDVLLHGLGWRAEQAQIIGLADWGSPLSRAAAKAVGARLGVRVLPIDQLEKFAAAHGQTLCATDFRVQAVEDSAYESVTFQSDYPQVNISVNRLDLQRPLGFKAFRLIEPTYLEKRIADYVNGNPLRDKTFQPEITSYLRRLPVQLVSLWPSFDHLLMGSAHPAVFWHQKEKWAECVINPEHVAPNLDCECGVSAFGNLTDSKREARTIFAQNGEGGRVLTSRDFATVIGLVAGQGDVVTSGQDWRAQSTELLALAVNPGTANRTTKNSLELLAASLGVPTVSLKRLRDAGRGKGAFLELA